MTKKIDLVFRTIGERTGDIALELAVKHVRPHRVHRIENVFPFSEAVRQMLQIDYDCDFVVFMDADCLILEDMVPFLECNEFPYVDCYVLDKFRGQIHQGVHITRIDVVRTMRGIEPPKNDEKYILRPESRLRSLALSQLEARKCFKPFRIFHDHFQSYPHIYAKMALRELRSRTDQNRRELRAAERYWANHSDDIDFAIAQLAVNDAREAVPPDLPLEKIEQYIHRLPEISRAAIAQLDLAPQPPLEYGDIEAQARRQWAWQLAGVRTAETPESPYKVFGIGLSRTGTKSLTSALHTLGFQVIHYPEDETTLRELVEGNYKFSLLDQFDGITDITVAPFYRQIDRLFPGSKFILTVRDKRTWLDSLELHYRNRPAFSDDDDSGLNNDTHMKIRRLLRAAVYGCYEFSRDRMSDVYDLHYKNVLDYFRDRPESLLIMDITAGDGWEKLCPFLNRPIWESPFPYTKKQSALKALLNDRAQLIVS